jgi:hypothetical protein
LETPPE